MDFLLRTPDTFNMKLLYQKGLYFITETFFELEGE
ncbi:hypothetical protein PPM_1237 [Paenibacillus polymyxa M1]|nr:hypothetical protein PPM_1237 [Paenibacillus polymyxa M1]